MLRFETLIERHHDEIYRYLWRLLAGAPGADRAVEAADLTQEVFARAYDAYGRLHPDSNYRAWLYRIATNCAMTTLRRSSRRAAVNQPLPADLHALAPDPAPTPDQLVSHAELSDGVAHSIRALPTKQQAALVMRYLQEMAYDEIAEVLECSADSARANVYQALKRLRSELAENEATRHG